MSEDIALENLRERMALWTDVHNSKKKQEVQWALCAKDPAYWFNNYCWTFDPRKEQSKQVFKLYDFQEWAIRQWIDCIDKGEDFGVEKSRDMGASWLLILCFQWGWLFKEGWDFHVGSRKEQDVCQANQDPSTLFGKFRYNLYNLPTWMRPHEVEKSDKKLSIRNPNTGNMFTGESANPSFGRGLRKKAVLFDELAFWDTADSAYGAASETTPCRAVISTPFGETNTFARLMKDRRNERVIYPKAKELVEAKRALKVAAYVPQGSY